MKPGSSFALASMSPMLRFLTWALFAIPVAIGVAAIYGPAPSRYVLAATFVFMSLTYASVWLFWRPTRFELDADGLRILWPLRTRVIPKGALGEATIVSAADFRREYGNGMRVGAGGLWGGFGLLVCRRETFSMWISRIDAFVLVRLKGARTLMITPEDPERFVEALRGAS